MNKSILMTLPSSDDVTNYLSVFSKEIVIASQQNQIQIKCLEKEKVTKENVNNLIKSLDCKMLIFNGHGSIKSIMGHKNEEIIYLGKNEALLKNRITYARSCWALAELGRKSVEEKKGCFIGYKIPFMFIINNTWATNPIKDNIAKIFFDTSNLVPIGLIKGHTARESDENSKKSMLKAINRALAKKDRDSQAIAQTLWNNYIAQDIAGNCEEKL